MDTKQLINGSKSKAMQNKRLSKDEICALLQIPENSPDCDLLGAAGHEVAKAVCNDDAFLWAALGLDNNPCDMDCKFCSLGEKWGLNDDKISLSYDDIVEHVKNYAADGIRWIVLRTTEYYSFEELAELIKKIKEEVPGEYEIGLNTGELDPDNIGVLYLNGCTFAYHALRLKEGSDTKFDPAVRVATLNNIGTSAMDLVSLVEPIGEEHSNEEIADLILNMMDVGASVSGAMARIPVDGTPLSHIPQISDRRLAQIIAVCRLAFGHEIADICVHPCSETAIKWGANVTVIERGVNPRDVDHNENNWKGFTADKAKQWFEKYGYKVKVKK